METDSVKKLSGKQGWKARLLNALRVSMRRAVRRRMLAEEIGGAPVSAMEPLPDAVNCWATAAKALTLRSTKLNCCCKCEIACRLMSLSGESREIAPLMPCVCETVPKCG